MRHDWGVVALRVPRCAGPGVGPVRPPRPPGRRSWARGDLNSLTAALGGGGAGDPPSALNLAAAFEGPAQRQLVGVLEVPTHRQAAGDAGHP
jgi:hypothetical protein